MPSHQIDTEPITKITNKRFPVARAAVFFAIKAKLSAARAAPSFIQVDTDQSRQRRIFRTVPPSRMIVVRQRSYERS